MTKSTSHFGNHQGVLQALNEPVAALELHFEALHEAHSMLSAFLGLFKACINFQSLPRKLREEAASPSVYHTGGGLLRGITPCQNLPFDMIHNWFHDFEHGFLHGFSVAFFASLFHGTKGFTYSPQNENLIVSCLLHDFLRSSNQHEEHDRHLKEWFSELLPVTYRHSQPLTEDLKAPLVIGDRLELLRYSDHMDWLEESKLAPYLKHEKVCRIVFAYFRFIRPALARLFQYNDDVWLRHSVESDLVLKHASDCGDGLEGVIEYGPEGSFPKRFWAPHTGYWCVEVGATPFGFNITRDSQSFNPLPLLNLSRYYELGGKALLPVRDHLAACGQIPLSEWIVLLYRDELKKPENEALLLGSSGFTQLLIANQILELSVYLKSLMKALVFRV